MVRKRMLILVLGLTLTSAVAVHGRAAAQAGWSAVPNGGLANEGPAVIARDGAIDLYVRGTDNQIYYTFWSSTTGWLPYTSFGGVFSSKPAAVQVPRSDTVAVAGRGQDGAFYVRLVAHTTATPWQAVPGGRFLGAPAIAYFNDALWLVGRGEDQRLYVAENTTPVQAGTVNYVASNWSAWTPISSDVFSSDPAVTVWGGRLVVASRDTSRTYRIATTFGLTWSAWSPMNAGVFSSEPAATVDRSGRLVIYGRGLDGTFWWNAFDGGSWTGVFQLPGRFFDSAPSASFNSGLSGSTVLVGTSLDEGLYLRWVP